jgi:hypothetical protein
LHHQEVLRLHFRNARQGQPGKTWQTRSSAPWRPHQQPAAQPESDQAGEGSGLSCGRLLFEWLDCVIEFDLHDDSFRLGGHWSAASG